MLRDLPGITDLKVGNRLLASAEPGGQAEPDKLARLRRSDRESHRPESVDLQAKVVRPGCQLDAERRLHVTAKHPGQPVARRGRHLPFLPEMPPSQHRQQDFTLDFALLPQHLPGRPDFGLLTENAAWRAALIGSLALCQVDLARPFI